MEAVMKRALFVVALAAACVAGCKKMGAPDILSGGAGHGRYVGVGIYSPGPGWRQINQTSQPKDASAAKLSDDDEIIVVVDSRTGEVRQCGNLSGVCIAHNPWEGAPAQSEPVTLAKHVDGSEPKGASDAVAATPPSK
jgi:hypothetical protein